MVINKPTCSFKYCKYNFDYNCTASEGKREGCEFRILKGKEG